MPEKTEIPSLPKYENIKEKILGQRNRLGIKSSNSDEEKFKQMIRHLHLKVTDQRLLILKSLSSGQRTHVTAQEVYEMVNKIDPSVGFATVYRFLRKLTEASMVTEVRMGGQPARYEITPNSHHDHLTCTHCGKIVEFENQDIERLQNEVAIKFGFELTSHVLELYGICSQCHKRESQLARVKKS